MRVQVLEASATDMFDIVLTVSIAAVIIVVIAAVIIVVIIVAAVNTYCRWYRGCYSC